MEKSFQVHRNAVTRAPRKYTRDFPQIAEAVEVVKVDKATWDRALKEAGGDRRRIQVLSESTVVIWNSVEQKTVMTKRRNNREDKYAINR